MLLLQAAGAWLQAADVSRVWQRPPLQQVAAKQVRHTVLVAPLNQGLHIALGPVHVCSALNSNDSTELPLYRSKL